MRTERTSHEVKTIRQRNRETDLGTFADFTFRFGRSVHVSTEKTDSSVRSNKEEEKKDG
jgi:hypothetical protein